MRKHPFILRLSLLVACTTCAFSSLTAAAPLATFPTRPLKFAAVNFKTCVENSKLGKQEQGTFEAMKKQMEGILNEKGKALNELAGKLGDVDYLDSLSPEAETELKRKFRALSQEASQAESQYYQTLQQANLKIIQKIAEVVGQASASVAKELKIDMVFNEESSFYHAEDLDISSLVIAEMDAIYEKEMKEAKPSVTPAPAASAVPSAPGKAPAPSPKKGS